MGVSLVMIVGALAALLVLVAVVVVMSTGEKK